MPLLDLTDLELETTARACRALAYQEAERAKKMENPTTRGQVENTAKRAAALAERFEAARKKARSDTERRSTLRWPPHRNRTSA